MTEIEERGGTQPQPTTGVMYGYGGDIAIVAKNPDNMSVKWYHKEVEFLEIIRGSCLDLAKQYMDLYTKMYQIQTRLRLPAIILSSFTGIASFGQGTFPVSYQRPVSITVGIINISIAILQTYESYLKIGDIVSKSLVAATSLKKLADRIHCEIFVPVDDREKSGIDYLREIFTVYQTILDQAPPLRQNEAITDDDNVNKIRQKIMSEFQRTSHYIQKPSYGTPNYGGTNGSVTFPQSPLGFTGTTAIPYGQTHDSLLKNQRRQEL